jgi:hypothetical protein
METPERIPEPCGCGRVNCVNLLHRRVGEPMWPQMTLRERHDQLAKSREDIQRGWYSWDRIPVDDAAVDAALDGLMQQVNHGDS